MNREWPSGPDPLNALHRVITERRFRYLEQDPEYVPWAWSGPLDGWVVQVLSCPVCLAEEGLDLSLIESTDPEVVVRCPEFHEWSEPRLIREHFIGYSRFRFLPEPDPDWAWLLEAGYGEEPPPPVDYWAEGREAAVVLSKYFANRAKRKIKAKTTGRLKKAVRQGRRKAGRAVTDTARAAGQKVRERIVGDDDVLEDELPDDELTEPGDDQEHIDVPSYAKYRKALGIPASKRGPRCLVCSDTGRITAPGVDIPCTECAPSRPRKSRSDQAGAGGGARVGGPGLYTTGDITGSVTNTGGRPLDLGAIRPRTGYRPGAHSGVRAGGRITGNVQTQTTTEE
ncbi:hypothetical protein [Kitasatospora cathayae]|uniref:Uncharacterized protein n=1 Tax=Kitasatospora cathayae TaxID=3004092 RepID=A0ABY7QH77_9ACTN|nr:hypothetical protein [Kitasatospora sp. HUAS 3-15]WBP92191.1 hypothetical protein O1G21_41005 [Kitasatospora sp. HUAS 3-15]